MEEKIQKNEERVVRISSTDIEGKRKIYPGLTEIKGISWGISNAICKILGINKMRTIGSLTEDEIKKINEAPKNSIIPSYLLNRQNDFERAENTHLLGDDLKLRKEFDIKRLKKIKSYRGYRHAMGLPTRGQRTRGHFRKNKRKGVGIKKKAAKREASPQTGGKRT